MWLFQLTVSAEAPEKQPASTTNYRSKESSKGYQAPAKVTTRSRAFPYKPTDILEHKQVVLAVSEGLTHKVHGHSKIAVFCH